MGVWIVIAALAACALWAVRRIWRRRGRCGEGCDGCPHRGGCPK